MVLERTHRLTRVFSWRVARFLILADIEVTCGRSLNRPTSWLIAGNTGVDASSYDGDLSWKRPPDALLINGRGLLESSVDQLAGIHRPRLNPAIRVELCLYHSSRWRTSWGNRLHEYVDPSAHRLAMPLSIIPLQKPRDALEGVPLFEPESYGTFPNEPLVNRWLQK